MQRKIIDVPDRTARRMLARAKAAMARTYPQPHTGYAAAALGASGKLYDGVSYCSSTQTLTMHCEMTALANAAIQGETDIVAMDLDGPATGAEQVRYTFALPGRQRPAQAIATVLFGDLRITVHHTSESPLPDNVLAVASAILDIEPSTDATPTS